jgi:hypothetical protein
MPLKTWTDYERLEAPDLNGAFAWSQESTLPGAWTATNGAPGPDTGVIATNAYGEVRHTVPPAGADPFAIFQSANGRLVIPVGMGGLWLYSASVVGMQPTTAGDTMQLYLNIDGSRSVNLGSCARYTGASSNSASGTQALMLTAGQVLFLEVRMMTSSGVANCRRWSLIRLGRGIGAPGATPAAYAGALPAPGVDGPEDEA